MRWTRRPMARPTTTRVTRPTGSPAYTRVMALGVAVLVLAGCAGTATTVTTGPGGTSTSTSTSTSTGRPTVAATPGTTALRPLGSTETARVVRIVDGDTLIIDRGKGRERLRYIGVNAPESVKPDTPVEFMGKEASAANAALVDGATVVLEKDVSDRDQYDRLLRYVWLRDGDTWRFVNLELVREGYAQAVTFPPDVRWIDTFRDAERVARDSGLGLWGAATPLP